MVEDKVRDRIHEFLRTTNDNPDDIEGAVLRNWVLVCDWVGVDGEKWLSHMHSEDASVWEVVGLLTAANDTYRKRLSYDEGDEDA